MKHLHAVRPRNLVLLVSLSCITAPTVPALAADTAAETRSRPLVERDIGSTKALTEALKRQDVAKGGGKAEEIAAIEAATTQAEKALNAGDVGAAGTLIQDAYRRAKTAIASLQKPSELKTGSAALEVTRQQSAALMAGEGAHDGYTTRRASVVALLETGRRIAGEKNSSRPEFAQAESLLKGADALAAAGKFGEGRTQLDQAYQLAKDAVRGLRSGEELTVDKNFASKADEYKYEQARNNDYQSLIGGVIHGQTDPSWGQAAERARLLRNEAEALGAAGDFGGALLKIEESTTALKLILRRAGFPII